MDILCEFGKKDIQRQDDSSKDFGSTKIKHNITEEPNCFDVQKCKKLKNLTTEIPKSRVDSILKE